MQYWCKFSNLIWNHSAILKKYYMLCGYFRTLLYFSNIFHKFETFLLLESSGQVPHYWGAEWTLCWCVEEILADDWVNISNLVNGVHLQVSMEVTVSKVGTKEHWQCSLTRWSEISMSGLLLLAQFHSRMPHVHTGCKICLYKRNFLEIDRADCLSNYKYIFRFLITNSSLFFFTWPFSAAQHPE